MLHLRDSAVAGLAMRIMYCSDATPLKNGQNGNRVDLSFSRCLLAYVDTQALGFY